MTTKNAIAAAFEDARHPGYQLSAGLDPDLIAEECSQLIDALDEMFAPLDIENNELEEERRARVLQEAFVRTFEAGFALGLEAGEEGMEVTLHIDRETVAGLVQRALSGEGKLKE
jgi:hypothetical protein